MNYRLFKSITVLDLALVILWFVLMIAGVLINGPIVTQDDAIQLISDRSLLFTLTYANAVVFTILTTFVFVGLYRYCRDSNEELSLIGLILVPVYSILNIAVYFSQIALVPALMQIFSTGENEIQKLILTQFVQACPGSSMAVLNNLAYAILGPLNCFPLMAAYDARQAAENGAAAEIELTPAELAWLDLKSDNR